MQYLTNKDHTLAFDLLQALSDEHNKWGTNEHWMINTNDLLEETDP